jgi:T4 gene Gp59 loader of gp41 DNA helicase
MNPFEAFELFMSLKTHFSSDTYDYFKYNGKMRVNKDNFLGRSDKFFFHKLSKRTDPIGYIISNLLNNENIWITSIFSAECENIYNSWKIKMNSLSNVFKNDIESISDKPFDELIKVNDQYPELLMLYRKKKISLETIIIINECVDIFTYWNKNIKDPVLWPDLYKKILKYKPFLELSSNKEKYKKILVDSFGK